MHKYDNLMARKQVYSELQIDVTGNISLSTQHYMAEGCPTDENFWLALKT